MCNRACLDFGKAHLSREDVSGKTVIDVGARDVNGSLRPDVQRLGPASYLGVDMASGPGVDEICDITGLVDRYGTATFDVVISTEVLEHVREWRGAISNLKRILKPNGILLVTTRSKGFPYHGYPYDFWRYELADIRTLFADFTIDVLESDPVSPGVFVKARKTPGVPETPLAPIALYSIVTRRRSLDVNDFQVFIRLVRRRARLFLRAILPARLQERLERAFS